MIDPEVFTAFSSLYIQNRQKQIEMLFQKDKDKRFLGYELEVIRKIIKDENKVGKTQVEIGELVGLSESAISKHLKAINKK